MLYENEYNLPTTTEEYVYEYEESMVIGSLFDKRSAPDYTESETTTNGRNQSYTYKFIEKINSPRNIKSNFVSMNNLII